MPGIDLCGRDQPAASDCPPSLIRRLQGHTTRDQALHKDAPMAKLIVQCSAKVVKVSLKREEVHSEQK